MISLKNSTRVCKKIFLIKAKCLTDFVLDVSKVLSEGVIKVFREKNHWGIRNQKLGNVKNFQV